MSISPAGIFRRSVLALSTNYAVPNKLRATMYRVARITVGEGTILYPHHRFSMKRDPNIVIGSECYINQYCWFDAGDATITLGDHVVVAANVSLQAATHVPGSATRRALGPYSHSIAIGDGCWIGVGAIILPGVTVAPGCVIGAGAVVTKSTEPNGVYAGVPALRIKDLPE